ncbi:MAG TPA: immunoglobulin domain-containing protein [Polyangiaceae bacterium]
MALGVPLAMALAACGDGGSAAPAPGGGDGGSGGASSGRGGAGRGGQSGRAGSPSDDAGAAGVEDPASGGSRAAAGEGGAAGEAGVSSGGTESSAGEGGGDSPSGGAAGGGGEGSVAPSDTAGVEGGSVGDADGNIVLTIPPGALLGETRFTFTHVSAIPGLSGDYAVVAGAAYRVAWSGAGFVPGASVSVRLREQALALRASGGAGRLSLTADPSAGVTECEGDVTWHDYVANGNDFEYHPTRWECTPGALTVGVVQGASSLAPPVITNAPAALEVRAGDRAQFYATVTGSDPVNYQWRRNGVNIPNARVPGFAVDPAFVGDDGARFSVTARNIVGSVTSPEALLTVLPPAAPTWNSPTELAPFGEGVDLPQVGAMADTGGEFAVWNDGGVIRGRSFTFAPINALAEPARGRPLVVSGRNRLTAYVVFVDDDGTGACTIGGNRLSIVGLVHRIAQVQPIPLFRDTLYQSSGCISAFAAGYASSDADSANPTPMVFALMEQSSQAIKVGGGGPYYVATDAAGTEINAWVRTTSVVSELPMTAACADNPSLSPDGLRGVHEAGIGSSPATSAVLAWVSHNHTICAATLGGGVWSSGSVVFGAALDAEPAEVTAAIDVNGRALVVASRVRDPAAQTFTYEMTAALREPAGGTWQLHALDSSAGLALPSAVFSAAGDAWVVWRPNLAAPPTEVYAARRPASGSWEPAARISAATATDTRFPRICSGSGGRMLALYSESSAGEALRVWSRVWAGGAWSQPARVQESLDEGRFAECARHGDSTFVAWRETDPATLPEDPPRHRVVAVE